MVRKAMLVLMVLLLSSSICYGVAHVSATPCKGCGTPNPPVELIVVVP